jgi:hypothetical protein
VRDWKSFVLTALERHHTRRHLSRTTDTFAIDNVVATFGSSSARQRERAAQKRHDQQRTEMSLEQSHRLEIVTSLFALQEAELLWQTGAKFPGPRKT